MTKISETFILQRRRHVGNEDYWYWEADGAATYPSLAIAEAWVEHKHREGYSRSTDYRVARVTTTVEPVDTDGTTA